jgi:hypothetical protein
MQGRSDLQTRCMGSTKNRGERDIGGEPAIDGLEKLWKKQREEFPISLSAGLTLLLK